MAALYVVLFHYLPLSASTNFSNPLKRLLDHGYLAVDLFFVLSGFVMAITYSHTFAAGWSKGAYLRFLGRRIARIYPLYLTATIVGFCFVVVGWIRYTRGAQLGPALFANLFLVQAWGIVGSFDSPAWSISAEWAAYLLFPVLLIPTMFRRPFVGWVCAVVAVAMLAVLCAIPSSLIFESDPRSPLNFNGYWCALPVLRCVPEFVLGILAFRLTTSQSGGAVGASRWIGPLLCLAVLALLTIPKSDLVVVVVFPLLVLSLASGTHLAARLLGSAPAEFLGRLSYSIYLTHKLLYGLLTWMYLHGRAAGIRHASLYAAVVCIALTFPISFLAYRYLEEPGRRWLRLLFEGRGTEPILHANLSSNVTQA